MYRLAAIALLLFALGDQSPGYYFALRIVVSAVAAGCAFAAGHSDKDYWMYTFGVIALLFNPLIPVYLEKDIWTIINLTVAGLFLLSLANLKSIKRIESDEAAAKLEEFRNDLKQNWPELVCAIGGNAALNKLSLDELRKNLSEYLRNGISGVDTPQVRLAKKNEELREQAAVTEQCKAQAEKERESKKVEPGCMLVTVGFVALVVITWLHEVFMS